MNVLFAQAAQPAAPSATPAATAVKAATAAPATAEAATTASEMQPADAPPKPAPQGGGFGMMLPMLIIFALFYFMMIKPQQRKEKERRKMIEELRAGAKVSFAGGLIGTIVEAKEKTFEIEIARDVVVEVARASVIGVVSEPPAAK
jgi:preprotein translocase subunit YajC